MNKINPKQFDELVQTLKSRFTKNTNRHLGLDWSKIQAKLESNPEKVWSLFEMERTGGEPDVVDYDSKNNTYIFCDCSSESPRGRRSLCYDQDALQSRKTFKPQDSVCNMAASMGVEILSEDQYRQLQTKGVFDTKSQSWLRTPSEIRKLGGAIFADRRYNHVFVYHNGAESYYAARGFRSTIQL